MNAFQSTILLEMIFFSVELSKFFRADALRREQEKRRNLLTHVTYTKETTVYYHLDTLECICVLLSLSVVYVFVA